MDFYPKRPLSSTLGKKYKTGLKFVNLHLFKRIFMILLLQSGSFLYFTSCQIKWYQERRSGEGQQDVRLFWLGMGGGGSAQRTTVCLYSISDHQCDGWTSLL